MVKAGKWIKSILIGVKKDKNKVQKEKHNSSNNPNCDEIPTTPIVITPATPKEKKRWSFRRSSATAPKDSNSNEPTPTKPDPPATAPEPPNVELKVDEADATNDKAAGPIQEAAAIKIQSIFKSYLARKALRALRGLVKLQALVRGRLVRKRATATLRCMEALITAQARARANRIRCAEERKVYKYNNHRQFTCRVNGEDYNFKNSYHEVEKGMMEENIKIVEMDIGEAKLNPKTRNNNYSYYQTNGRRDERFSTHYASDSPAPSAVTDTSPRTCSGHFEDYHAFTQSSPQCYDIDYYPLNPSYMANTQSSRAKARSQSAPKQRPDSFERRPSLEGRNIPRAVRMQRSSSNVGPTSQSYYHYPWSIKLDKSSVSLIGSECGSNCSVLTTTNYCRSQVPYEHQGHRY